MKKNSCPYCGNNPVPHFVNWYVESLNILLTPLRQLLVYNYFFQALTKRGWGRMVAGGLLRLGEILGIITFQTDISKCKVRRAVVMWEEAIKRGIMMKELLLWGKPFDCYIAEKSKTGVKQKIIFSGLPRPLGYTNKWLDLMDDKWLLKEKFTAEGLPVPAGASCRSLSQALKMFRQIRAAGNQVIVKPRAGSRGRHSTTFVATEEDLKHAFYVAKQLCFWVMVETQLPGPVYRATVINFQLAGVLRGDSPQVTGDGRLTVGELVRQKNQQPHPGVQNVQMGASEINFLKRQKLSPDSILPAGQTVSLSEKIGVSYGGSSSEDYEICHPDNRELFTRAAKSLGDPLVGFDFIIPDITKSYREQKCGFIEVNSLPFINLHHDPLLGHPRNVSAKVWDMIGM